MRILQIQSTYGKGSTGIIAHDLNNCVLSKGWESYVAYRDIREDLKETTSGYKIGNIIDRKIHALLSRISGRQGYFSFIPTLGLIRYIKRVNPDVIQIHEIHSNYINLNLLTKYLAGTDIKVVVTLHDCWLFTGGCCHYTSLKCQRWQGGCGECPGRPHNTSAYLFDKSADILKDRYKYFGRIKNLKVVGVSNWIAEECQKGVFKGRDVRTIHNGVDTDVFKPTESDLAEKLGIKDKFIILAPASKWLMNVNKEALDYFCDNMSEDEALVLFGCKNIRQDLPRNVIQYGFTSSQKELAKLYSMANVFVNLTHEDSLSLINIEAQACGTPIVTYKNTGAKETVDGTYSKAVETDDYVEIFNTVRAIKDGSVSDRNLGTVSFIRDNFEKSKNYEQYIKLYQE